MSYAKKAAMKIEKREPREPHAVAGMKGKPLPKKILPDHNTETPMHDGNKPTHHAHLYGEIPAPKDKPHILKKLGC